MTKEAEVFGTKDRNISSCCNNPPNTCYFYSFIHIYFPLYEKDFFTQAGDAL